MGEFQTWHDYFDFATFVKTKARHVMDAKAQSFLNVLLQTAERRKGRLHEGAVLWRAALGQEYSLGDIRDENGILFDLIKMPKPYPPERMKPLADRAQEGRVNPKGIPCLYLSDDRATAMTEVRPWIGSHISVATFTLIRELTFVDCSLDTKRPEFMCVGGGEPDPANRERDVWWSINEAFSEPVERTDDVADYAPTQVLAEVLRTSGTDAILYSSNLGDGKNVAVFDVSAARLVRCDLHTVAGVKLTVCESRNSYEMREQEQ